MLPRLFRVLHSNTLNRQTGFSLFQFNPSLITGSFRAPDVEWWKRVARTAVPLQALLLSLLGTAALLPLAVDQDAYSCILGNSLLFPMLHYVNGPPPF